MSDGASTSRPLAAPSVTRTHFGRNFIAQAVCELRFPTLFDLDNERPPLELARLLRKDFPSHQHVTNIKLENTSLEKSNAHIFKARKDRWTVTLRTSAVLIETNHYDNFEEFHEKLGDLIKASRSTIDSDFFTRIGLRYINAIPCARNDVFGWVNSDLCAPLTSGVFGDPKEFSGRVQGLTKSGAGYQFQHGFGLDAKTGKEQYVLDYDFFAEDIQVDDALKVVTALHDEQHLLFRWCLGPRSKEWLGVKEE